MWLKLHDKDGEVGISELTYDGIHNAKYQCERMLEELEEAREKLDAEESGDAE